MNGYGKVRRMTRNPKRVKKVLVRLAKIWSKHPDMRLGQLIENVFPNTDRDYISAYAIEDEEYIKTIEEFYAKNSTLRRVGDYRCKSCPYKEHALKHIMQCESKKDEYPSRRKTNR